MTTTQLVSLLLISLHQSKTEYRLSKKPPSHQFSQSFVDRTHRFTFASAWNLIRESQKRRKGCIDLTSLTSPHLKVFTYKVIGKTFDKRLREARVRFEKFIIKTESVVSKGLSLGYAFDDKRLLGRLEEQMAQVIFREVVRPARVRSNKLESFESM